jgi:putative methyltransferase
MWNWEYNKHVAQKIKESNPDSIIVFGGPQVTSRPEEEQFFVKHPYVDSISLSEGEQSFVAMLDKVVKGETLDKIYQGGRLTELDIPSPYLTGVFDKIMANAPKDDLWNGTIETNRGCPFACTFCDWGSLTYAKIKKFPVPKVLQELTWMSERKVDYVTIADANFGVFTDRDLEFTEKLVELQNEYGYPKVVDATWYKNSSDEILEIVKKFISSGFNRGLTLSVQSMDMDVLDEIKRRNMEMSDLKMIFDKCNRENIPSYTELILGLPKETYESWKRGVCEVLDAGQHNAIESWLAQLLENAHMNLPEEREKHGLTTVIVENYISGFEEEDNIPEKVELVTGTKYMPTPKFIDAWSYSWMINNFHNFGWSQVITRFLRMYKDYSYEMMYDRLLENIKEDNGPVGNAFNEARALLAEYLETGEIGVASGHTLMWEAQKDFHRFPHAVEKLVKDTFTDKFCDLDPDQFFALMTAQENYTTKEDHYYPHQVLQEYNIYEYINGIDDLKKADVIYDIDIGEKVKGEEYFNRLYFRRRQGWGKSIIKNTTKST